MPPGSDTPVGHSERVNVGHDWIPIDGPVRILDTAPPGKHDLWLWCIGHQTQRAPLTAGEVLDVNAMLIPNE